MPRARGVGGGGDARVPRRLWTNAQKDNQATYYYPAWMQSGGAEAILLIPSNWNGLDSAHFWILTTETFTNVPFDITGHLGTHGEPHNQHTQTVLGTLLTIPANQYYRWRIDTVLNTLFPNLAANDILWIEISEQWGMGGYWIGLEVRES